MQNKLATGKAIRGAERVQHRGVTYWVSGSRVWREAPGGLRFVGWIRLLWSDVRNGIDDLLSPEKPALRPAPKLRQFGRIMSHAQLQGARRVGRSRW